jgi:hypothetical protein
MSPETQGQCPLMAHIAGLVTGYRRCHLLIAAQVFGMN